VRELRVRLRYPTVDTLLAGVAAPAGSGMLKSQA
jgi:hypothetical protein